MNDIVIYGDSDFAERIYLYIKLEKEINVLAFTNSRNFKTRDVICGLPVIPFEELDNILKGKNFKILIAVGYSSMNKLRSKIHAECVNAGFSIATYISKTAILYSNDIGEGTIIMPNVYIGPRCSIGTSNIFAANSCVAHDNTIGDFNFISSNVALGGGASVLNNCFLGLSSTIKDGVIIEEYSLLGQAANVLQSTDKYGVYAGNPAKKIRNNSLESKI